MEYKKDKNTDLSIRDSLFSGSNLLHHSFKRTLKISKAVYVITEIIKDNEPLKWSLRSSALSLIDVKDFGDIRQISKTIISRIGGLKALVFLANFSKHISEMNTNILIRECDDLIQVLSDFDSFEKHILSLDKEFFDVPRDEFVSPFVSVIEKEKILNQGGKAISHKGQLKDSNMGMSFRSAQNSDGVRGGGNSAPTDQDSEIKDMSNKSFRRNQILNIIKDKGEVMIKDISTIITDCSEKTIQRELMSLLSSRTIKKTGDRRWSKYSLV